METNSGSVDCSQTWGEGSVGNRRLEWKKLAFRGCFRIVSEPIRLIMDELLFYYYYESFCDVCANGCITGKRPD